jgi:hypothetical protein
MNANTISFGSVSVWGRLTAVVVGVIVLAMLTAGSSANAAIITITPTSPSAEKWTSDNNSNIDANDLETFLDIKDDNLANGSYNVQLTSGYKQNVGGGESGTFADNYSTVFSNTATDPEDALISWDGSPELFIDYDYMYLVIKDGNANPAVYVYNLNNLQFGVPAYQWNGKDTLRLEDFWPSGKDENDKPLTGAISHVEIFYGGSPDIGGGGRTVAPEPASLVTWGVLGLVGLVYGRRRRTRA